ncbi:MAG TPA: cytidine deaminase [bacterium]|jgi:cytidine deaminase|nr:cytidine deaminase [bacterium]HOC89504.1 cytidine deaminase [bacterium]HOZ21609.1 cytidine deaminase [bacterium]
MPNKTYDPVPLIRAAFAASAGAKALYSHFQVGAALLCADGGVVTGFNIESSSYGLTICAERVAMFRALSEGKSLFTAIAIVSGGRNWCPPCGACRQVLWEWAGEIDVILARSEEEFKVLTLSELLPHAFDNGYLPNA